MAVVNWAPTASDFACNSNPALNLALTVQPIPALAEPARWGLAGLVVLGALTALRRRAQRGFV